MIRRLLALFRRRPSPPRIARPYLLALHCAAAEPRSAMR